MKNALCLLVGMGCLGAYYCSSRPVLTVPAPVPAVTDAAVAAAPTPRLYYHSPLDAPAMRAEVYTGMGYFSPVKGGFDVAAAQGQTRNVLAPIQASYDAGATTGARTSMGDPGLTRLPAGAVSASQNPLDQAAAATRANTATISAKSLGALASD